MRRLLLLALLCAGCQQAMQVPEPTLQRPEISAQTELLQPTSATPPPPPPFSAPQPHPYQYLPPQVTQHPWIPFAHAAPPPPRRIVIPHPATQTDCAAPFDR